MIPKLTVKKLMRPLRFLKSYIKLRDLYWAKLIAYTGDIQDVEIGETPDRLYLKRYGIEIDKVKHEYILFDKYGNIRTLASSPKISLYRDKQGCIIAETKGVQIEIESVQDAFIVNEVFVNQIYNFVADCPVVVVDIGMNIGIASLFFATQENVCAVIGYEPVKATIEQASRNFARNPHIREKITPIPYGIGAETRNITVESSYENKGSIGIFAIPEHLGTGVKSKIEIQLHSIAEEIEVITSKFPDMPLVAKIDCEGAEYEIIETLYEVGKLKLFQVLMIEWHQYGPDKLIERLQTAGFYVFSMGNDAQKIGMLYASRKQPV